MMIALDDEMFGLDKDLGVSSEGSAHIFAVAQTGRCISGIAAGRSIGIAPTVAKINTLSIDDDLDTMSRDENFDTSPINDSSSWLLSVIIPNDKILPTTTTDKNNDNDNKKSQD